MQGLAGTPVWPIYGGSGRLQRVGIARSRLWGHADHHAQADVSLQMSKEHLDLSPLHERGHLGVGLANVAGNVSCCFVNGSEHFPGELARAALRVQVAGVAVPLARPVADQTVLADIRGARLREFPAASLKCLSGRSGILVGARIVGKVISGEGAVGAFRFVPDGDVGADLAALHQPAQHLG